MFQVFDERILIRRLGPSRGRDQRQRRQQSNQAHWTSTSTRLCALKCSFSEPSSPSSTVPGFPGCPALGGGVICAREGQAGRPISSHAFSGEPCSASTRSMRAVCLPAFSPLNDNDSSIGEPASSWHPKRVM